MKLKKDSTCFSVCFSSSTCLSVCFPVCFFVCLSAFLCLEEGRGTDRSRSWLNHSLLPLIPISLATLHSYLAPLPTFPILLPQHLPIHLSPTLSLISLSLSLSLIHRGFMGM